VCYVLVSADYFVSFIYLQVNDKKYANTVVMLSFRSFILVEYKPIHVQFIFSAFQVDAMLQKLEKEIDDVDARIGNRWQLLDR
jgi:hypothetical protein